MTQRRTRQNVFGLVTPSPVGVAMPAIDTATDRTLEMPFPHGWNNFSVPQLKPYPPSKVSLGQPDVGWIRVPDGPGNM